MKMEKNVSTFRHTEYLITAENEVLLEDDPSLLSFS